VVFNEKWAPFTVGNLANWSHGDRQVLACSMAILVSDNN